MFSERETRERQKQLMEERAPRHTIHEMPQAEVSKELMTGNPDWDIFLQQLQGKIEEAAMLRDGEKMKLDNPNLSDPIEIQIIRQHIFIYNNSIDVLKSVMEMPLEIVSPH